MELRVEQINKSYGNRHVLRDFSASFQSERVTCILGESGCGKTTLMRILIGLEQQYSCQLTGFAGVKRSTVFQEDRLCPNLSALANVKLVCDSSITKQEIIRNLEQVGLGQCAHQPVHELSGGQKRRTAIVRALMAEYDILYLDEPLKGLDADTLQTVVQYVKDKIENKTVIMITHSKEEVQLMDGIALLM